MCTTQEQIPLYRPLVVGHNSSLVCLLFDATEAKWNIMIDSWAPFEMNWGMRQKLKAGDDACDCPAVYYYVIISVISWKG